MTKDYYRILGVLDDAEDVVIRAAYKALAQRYHPDKWTGDKEEANRRMQEINEAYGVLSDSAKRKQYDATREKAEYSENQSTNFEDEYQNLSSDWEIAQKIYPDLIEIEKNLIRLSGFLGFTFRLLLLENKKFSERDAIASEIERAYLGKYFGNDRSLQSFAKELILEGRRDVAKELNDYIRVIGSELNPDQIIEKLAKKYRTRRYREEQEANIRIKENQKYNSYIFLTTIVLMLIGVVVINFTGTKGVKNDPTNSSKSSNEFVPYTGELVPNKFNSDISGKYSQINDGFVTAKISGDKVQLITANPQGCSGEVDGELNEYSRGKYYLIVSGENCKISLYQYVYSGKSAIKIEERDCWNYHGLNCNFSGVLVKE